MTDVRTAKFSGAFLDYGGALYNVTHPDFGAVGDGVTDDTAAIQAALDASGGSVFFPAGTYLCSSDVVDGATIVVGAGTTLDFADNGGWLVTTSGEVSTDGPAYRVVNNVGSGQVYGIFIITDSSAVDTAAGLSIRNIGHSDNLYLEVSGKPTGASSPTGIGVDLNKQAGGSGEESSQMAGFGIQIFDHSTTDQGVDGPHMIYLLKTGNMNTEHPALEITANRHAIRLIDDPGVGGWDGAFQMLSHWRADTGAERWRFNANGKLVFVEDDTGILFEFLALGNQGAIKVNRTDETVDHVGGPEGVRFLDNAGSVVNVQLTEQGTINMRVRTSDPGNAVKGTLAYADGTSWNPGSGEGVYRYDGTVWVYLG